MDRAALGVGIGEGAFGVAELDPGFFGFDEALGLGGVIRKPGSTLVYRGTEGTLALTMAEGKVTGATASLKGEQLLGTGSAASLAGKPYTATSKSPARRSGRLKSSGNSATERS